MPAAAKGIERDSDNTFTPITIAALHSSSCKLLLALCNATREDEQAVSMLKHGPWTPKRKDRRPAATDRNAPVASKTDKSSKAASLRWMLLLVIVPKAPTKTPIFAPRTDSNVYPESRRASWPTSITRRCPGSIWAASASEMSYSLLLNDCNASYSSKPPYRMQSNVSFTLSSIEDINASESHLHEGTSTTKSLLFESAFQRSPKL